MTNKIFLNIKDLVEELISLDSIEDLAFASFEQDRPYQFTSDQLESFHIKFIYMSLKSKDRSLHLVDFAFAEQYYIEYHQVLDLLSIGELEIVKKIIQNLKKIKEKQNLNQVDLEKRALLVQKSLGVNPNIIESNSFVEFQERLLDANAEDLEYCTCSSRYDLDNVWNLDTAIGIRSRKLNKIWTISGNNTNQELTEGYKIIFSKDQSFLEKIKRGRLENDRSRNTLS